MKKFALATTVAFSVALSAGLANAASTASDASASIVAAIAISNEIDLNFGQIVPNLAIGTVVVTPAGARSVGTGTLTLADNGTAAASSFTVTGAVDSTYSITLPSSITITGPGAPMNVNAFESFPDGTGTLTGGEETLLVGATLNVGVSQVAGSYAGTFNVVVNYN